MNSISNEPELLKQVLTLISTHFGPTCEVVLHDLKKDYNSTIVDIRNGHITNRDIGGCGSNLGLEVLRGKDIDGDRFNYVTHTASGKIIRSSSIYLKDSNNEVIGSICVNVDITQTVQFENYLKQFNHYEIETEEVFANDVENLLEYLVSKGQRIINKPFESMSKDEKIEFIQYLDRKGAFLVKKSGDKICDLLKISKFTLYNYLDIIRD